MDNNQRGSGNIFEEIDNPYGTAFPIDPTGTNRHLFVGRDEDIAALSNYLIDGGEGKSIFIYGLFRSGKSTFRKFLSAKIQENDPRNIIVDNLTVMSCHNLNDIVDMIINAIIRKIKWKYHTVPEVLSEFRNIKTSASDYARIFVDFSVALKECIQTELPDLRILVVLDGFDHLIGHADSTFAELWKSVMECNAFNAILIGHDSIPRIIRENQNAFGIARLFHISYLSKEAAQRLITEPTAVIVNGEKKSRFIGNAVEYIWEQTGGNVFYLQTICQLAVDYMNTHHMSYINEIHIQRALRTYAEVTAPSDLELKGHPLFQSNDGDDGISDRENKMVLDAIVKTTEAKNGSTMKAIHEYLVSTYNKNALSEKRVKEVLFSLLSRKVITCSADGKYDIIVKFYGDYLNDTIIKGLLLL